MKKKWHWLALWLTLLPLVGSAEGEPNSYQKVVIERFLKTTFSSSGFGYVFEGAKPLAIFNVAPTTQFVAPQSERFRNETVTREVQRLWPKKSIDSGNFVLKFTSLTDGRLEVMLINKPLLYDVIEKELVLFQYVLGPTTTTSLLVEEIACGERSLIETLKMDRTLEGIVLGFGTFNSLMHGRAETIQNADFSCDCPPFAANSNLMLQHATSNYSDLQLAGIFLTKLNRVMGEFKTLQQPGMWHASLEEELDAISTLKQPLPRNLRVKSPRFIFGAYQGGGNSERFSKIEIAQRSLSKLLERPDFTEYVVGKLIGSDDLLLGKAATDPQMCIEQCLAAVVAEASGIFDPEVVPYFIKAILSPEDWSQAKCSSYCQPGILEGFLLAKDNLKAADKIMRRMHRDRRVTTIQPELLYLKTVRSGKNQQQCQHDKVKVTYKVEDIEGNLFSEASSQWISLSGMIPGFSYGVTRMHVGQTATLYVHPALAYGIHTTLPPCSLLKITVTVHDEDLSSPLAEIKEGPIDLSWIRNEESYRELRQNSIDLAKALGSRWGSWLASGDRVDITVLGQLLSKIMSDSKPVTATEREKEQCNTLFCKLLEER